MNTKNKLLLGEPRKGVKEGYLTIDFFGEPDILFDLSKPLTEVIEPGSVDLIGSFHMLEHLHPTVVPEVVKSWVECLKPGGALVIETPNFDAVVRWYMNAGELKAKQWIFGDDSRLGQNHLWGYNAEELLDLFKDLPVSAYLAEPQDYHKQEGPCLRIEVIKL